LASFKIPQYTVIMAGFPMTSSGKVQKFKLREMATASLGLGQSSIALPT
jgi:fatty-acyl-CoA synthase